MDWRTVQVPAVPQSPAEIMAAELQTAGVTFGSMAKTVAELMDKPMIKTNSWEEYVDNKTRLEAMKFAATVMGVKWVSGSPTVNVWIFANPPRPDEPLQY